MVKANQNNAFWTLYDAKWLKVTIERNVGITKSNLRPSRFAAGEEPILE